MYIKLKLNLNTTDYNTKRSELANKNENYKKQLEKRSSKKWQNLKKQNETSYKKTKSKTATTSKNASGPLNVQSQPRELSADQGLEKEGFELFRAENTSQKVNKSTNANETLQEETTNKLSNTSDAPQKEATNNFRNISDRFITDNRKTILKRSPTFEDVVQSSQDTSSSGENVIDFESIKRDLLKSDNSIKPVFPPVLSTDSSSSQNASCFHEYTQDRVYTG